MVCLMASLIYMNRTIFFLKYKRNIRKYKNFWRKMVYLKQMKCFGGIESKCFLFSHHISLHKLFWTIKLNYFNIKKYFSKTFFWIFFKRSNLRLKVDVCIYILWKMYVKTIILRDSSIYNQIKWRWKYQTNCWCRCTDPPPSLGN